MELQLSRFTCVVCFYTLFCATPFACFVDNVALLKSDALSLQTKMNELGDNVVFNYNMEDSYRFYGRASSVGPYSW